VAILSQPVYRGFGPTLAAEYLEKKHGIAISRETARQWMARAKLWRAKKQHIEEIHEWRPRRSRFGELVQWDTSDHDWLEGRGEEILLINMIDDATSRWFEHRDRLVAAVGREPMARFGRDPRAMDARRVLQVADDLAGGSVDHHHVRAACYERPAPWRIPPRCSRSRHRP
jgi:hypothetical protein